MKVFLEDISPLRALGTHRSLRGGGPSFSFIGRVVLRARRVCALAFRVAKFEESRVSEGTSVNSVGWE